MSDASGENMGDAGGFQNETYVPFPTFESFAAHPFDGGTLASFVKLMNNLRDSAGPSQLQNAVRTATKWAAVDTGAIEGLYEVDRGFTFSVAAEAAAWDNIHLVVGAEAEQAIHDALAGYDYVMDVATSSRPITESWIRELHSVLCASQETYTVVTGQGIQKHPLPRGAYKAYPNNPLNIASGRVHAYAPVADTAAEMARMVKELESKAFKEAHPVLQAAYAHYAFVCIHPFADGNGRVSRALASVYLYRSPGVPLVIFADQKAQYLDALEAADSGETAPFIRFMTDRAIDVVRMVMRDMQRPVRVPLVERLEQMNARLVGRGGLPHQEVDALARLVADTFKASLNRCLERNSLTSPLSASVSSQTYAYPSQLADYRTEPRAVLLTLKVKSEPPALADLSRQFAVWIAKGTAQVADFVVVDVTGEIVEEVLLRDVYPTVNPSLAYRLDIAAEDAFMVLVEKVMEAAEQTLRQSGYVD